MGRVKVVRAAIRNYFVNPTVKSNRIFTHAPMIGFPPIRGGRTRNCHAASRSARDRPPPGGDSSIERQFSTRKSGAVRHAISAQPVPLA